MKIQYVCNTCDWDGIDAEGEIMVVFKDGKIAYHHDYSDGALELDYVSGLLDAILGVNIEFDSIKPNKAQIKEINEYLSEKGY